MAEADAGRGITRSTERSASAAIRSSLAPAEARLDEFDFVLPPVLRQPLQRLGGDAGPATVGAFPVPFGILGRPVMSIPFEHDATLGLPVGIQATSRLGYDDVLLGLAQDIENHAPWSMRWPAVAVS